MAVINATNDSFKKEVKGYGIKLIKVQRPMKICEGVYSTGELRSDIKEQSLIIHTDEGLIVITGCSSRNCNSNKKGKRMPLKMMYYW